MRIEKHIAYRFLTNKEWLIQYICRRYEIHDEGDEQEIFKDSPNKSTKLQLAKETYDLLHPADSKNYFVTKSITEKLDLLKVKRQADGQFNWSIFNHIPVQKATFILPDQKVLRVKFYGNMVYFMFVEVVGHGNDGFEPGYKTTNWVHFFYKKTPNGAELCEHWSHLHVNQIEEYIYKLFCFIYLSDTEEVIVQPGHGYGTKKQGKFINPFKLPLIVVNSNWNVTSIRDTPYPVSGHFAIRWTGAGRTLPRTVWIDPFEKKGYIRKAKITNHE